MDLILSPRKLSRRLYGAIAVLTALGLGAEWAYQSWNRELAEPYMKVLSLSEEHNLPTWFSAALHVLSGSLLALIACGVRRANGPFLGHWAFLSGVFFYISLDESILIHENMNRIIEGGTGAFYFDWIIPASGILIVGALAYLRFLKHLPQRSRRDFITAGSIFVGGALLMEIPLGLWTDAYGWQNMGYILIDSVEETMEMVGSSMFVVALMRHLGGQAGEVSVRIADGLTQSPAADGSLVERTTRRASAAVVGTLSSESHDARD